MTKRQLSDANDLLTVAEVATALRTHVSTVYRWIRVGEMRAVRFGRACTCGSTARGGAIRIPASELHVRLTPALATSAVS